jgi:hypothetical protein
MLKDSELLRALLNFRIIGLPDVLFVAAGALVVWIWKGLSLGLWTSGKRFSLNSMETDLSPSSEISFSELTFEFSSYNF